MILTHIDKKKRTPVLDMSHVKMVNEDGSLVLDRFGKPCFRPRSVMSARVKTTRQYLVTHDGDQSWMTLGQLQQLTTKRIARELVLEYKELLREVNS
tara:strand:- start:11627 stop:11917 length:291 start_codon:yes stop_codon:yes gene_type:complete